MNQESPLTLIKSGVFETQESKTTYKYKKYNNIIGMTISNLALMFNVEKLEFPYQKNTHSFGKSEL